MNTNTMITINLDDIGNIEKEIEFLDKQYEVCLNSIIKLAENNLEAKLVDYFFNASDALSYFLKNYNIGNESIFEFIEKKEKNIKNKIIDNTNHNLFYNEIGEVDFLNIKFANEFPDTLALLIFMRIRDSLFPESDFYIHHKNEILYLTEEIIKQNLIHKNDFYDAINIIKELYKIDDIYVTIINNMNMEIGEFDENNKQYMLSYLNNQIEDLNNSKQYDSLRFSILVKKYIDNFENIVAMGIFDKNYVYSLPKKHAIEFNSKCLHTGIKFKKDKKTIYKNLKDLFIILEIDVLNIKN